MPAQIDIFFSYAHKDEELRDQLAAHLDALRQSGMIRDWHDRRLKPGDDWEHELDSQIEKAHVILLLVSVDFAASKYCVEVEMKRALERHALGAAHVIPVILRACRWQNMPLAKLQVLPKDGVPIMSWNNRDEAWMSVVDGILTIANEIQDGPLSGPKSVPTINKPPTPSRPQIPRPAGAGLLLRERIAEIHTAVLEARMNRDRLLHGIDVGVIARLPQAPAPASQMLADLEALNLPRRHSGGTRPLRSWLENARHLAGDSIHSEVFVQALRDLPKHTPNTETDPPAPVQTPGTFLSMVERLCRLREGEDAAIEWRRAPPPFGGYLEVSVKTRGFARTHPVAALEDDVSTEAFDSFVRNIDAVYRKVDPWVASTLVYGGQCATAALFEKATTKRVHLVSFVEYQGLIDFRRYLEWQTTKLRIDPVYPTEMYVDQRLSLSAGVDDDVVHDDGEGALAELLSSPHGRFILVLGDFGSGKTFLLHKLALRMSRDDTPIIPILFELRALEKARSLDALIAQHLAMAGMGRIDLTAFRHMLADGRIALLFDGFDELALRVTYARAIEHFDTLIQAAQGNAKIVVTCRTQHFISEAQVKTVLAERAALIPGYRVANVHPFSPEHVRCFFVKRLGSEQAADARLRLLADVHLLGLSRNPRMLGFMAQIEEAELRQAKIRNGEITGAGLYKLLLEKWLVYEHERTNLKGAAPNLTLSQRWRAVTEVASRLWHQAEPSMSFRDLPGELVAWVEDLADESLDTGVTEQQIGSGTLLVRDENDNFRFMHYSILEWLVAQRAAAEVHEDRSPTVLAVREMSDLMTDFFHQLVGAERAQQWAWTALRKGGDVAKKNALHVLDRLGAQTKIGVKLAGQDLRGKDFSGQDFRGADLSGADLSDARFVDTNLGGATLARAKLVRADLTRARLMSADLTGADLSFATLLDADLREAKLSGVRFRVAKLLGAKVDAAGLAGCDMFGATVPEPARIDAMILASSPCLSVALSPDGTLLASGHTDGLIRLWDTVSIAARRVLSGHVDVIRSVAFSPDGLTLASGSDDTTARLWDVSSGTERRVLVGHTRWVLSVAFSPDGREIATGSDDKTVRLWDAGSGTELRLFLGHVNSVNTVAFSPDGRSLATGSYDNTIRIWNIASGAARRVLLGHGGSVNAVSWSSDGSFLASGSSDATVRLWNVESGTERRLLSGHAHFVLSVALSVDGRTVVSGSADLSVRVWDTASGLVRHTLAGHSHFIHSVAVSADGSKIASGSSDRTIRLWDTASGSMRCIRSAGFHGVGGVAWSADGTRLASACSDHTVQLWDVARSSAERPLLGHTHSFLSVAFSPDGHGLASGSSDHNVWLWNLTQGNLRVLSGHGHQVNSVAFSPDGSLVASGSSDATVRLWSTENSDHRVLLGHMDAINSVAFDPRGSILASGSDDLTIRLWDVASGAQRRPLVGHTKWVMSVAFCPDGSTLASGARDETIRLWNIASQTTRCVLSGHTHWVMSVAFSPDGRTLVSGSYDGTIRLWNASSGSLCNVLSGHTDGVVDVTFSPDGSMIASCATDRTIRLWDAASGRCLAVLLSLTEGWVAYAPDGRFKLGGDTRGAFWHAIGLCRFEPGELDRYLPSPLRVPDSEPMILRSSRLLLPGSK